MKELGYRVIDLLVDHFESLPEMPVGRKASRQELERILREPVPAKGEDPEAVIQSLLSAVFRNTLHVNHPRFLAWVPSPNSFVSVMAETLSAGFNVFAGTWLESSGPAQIELITCDWLCRLFELPSSSGGVFMSGGSMANLSALAVARHIKLGGHDSDAVIYASDQTHSSVEKALKVLGFGPTNLRRVPCNAQFQLDLTELSEAVKEDRSLGRRPFCVVANAGTTNTGAVDPLSRLAGLCRSEDIWLHADAAYGGGAILSESGKRLLKGIGEVDSLTLDPHKWLFQCYETGCLLVRESDWLEQTYAAEPEYLQDARVLKGQVNFSDRTVQLTRSFRALKLWMSLKVFGLDAFREAVSRGIELGEQAERIVRETAELEVVTPAQLAMMTLRFSNEGADPADTDRINQEIVGELVCEGSCLVNSTVLNGRTVLHICTINPRTTLSDLKSTVRRIAGLGRRLQARPPEEAG